ncbi:MFS general substrate transporter [Aspergillus steynii IBT 23096]|uniref:MFS general substrate transporter n=1 Tax=Aspergillus steynii IBT 23096 TaxID=1392250 RepID=A0A2I2FRV7_9EURO|nr:MFS general substrate transporter [Aspergillus steynii IBT 23096]PLB43364.1 MFS general substrate transporter [Aspergillus steynii IBT 23096]
MKHQKAPGEETTPAVKGEVAGAMDQAASYLAQSTQYPPMTPEMEKKLIRKLDWILVPMLFLTATLGAVDKVAISTAAIYGLKEDLHLVGQQYSWAGSILSIGSIVGMWPSSYLIQKLPSAKYLSSCAFGWSAMALLVSSCRNWGGLMALRFFMGCLEAIIVPSVTLIVAGFYKKHEQPPRNAIVLAAVSSVINGFLSWAVGHIPDSAPLAIWQYLYLIVGTVSITWSIVAFIFLPDSPMTASFLSEQEKYYAVQRVAENKTGIVNKQWKGKQALEAVMDPKTWILFFFNIAINIPNGGKSNICSVGIIINNLGFSPVNTSLLNMPTGIMSTLSAFFFSWLAAKWTDRRCLVTMIAACLPIIGSVIVYTLPRTNIGGQMVGIYLVCCISMAQANTAGHTKKNFQYSILYIGYAVGNLIGPQTFREEQAPAYTGGFIAMLACYCICISLIAVYWVLVARLNRRLEGVDPESEASNKHVRCTEEKPRCRRCERLNLKCERGLRLMYQEDALQRGISFGRKGKWSKNNGKHELSSPVHIEAASYTLPLDKYVGRWIFLNTTNSDFDIENHPSTVLEADEPTTEDLSELELEYQYLDLMTSSFRHPLAEYSEVESYLLDYFIHGIGPNCALSQVDNPYISLITPLCFVHPTLRNALLAAAGNQLRLLGDTRFIKETLIYTSRALKSLNQAISQNRIDDGVIATVLMLCFHDISDECDPSWITHLHAGLELLNHTGSHCESPSLLKFVTMYFVAHDIMSRTAAQSKTQVKRRYSWTENDDLDEIDMVMGCSRRLMSLINDISDMATELSIDTQKEFQPKEEDQDLNTRTNAIRSALSDLKQTLPTHSADRDDLSKIAEIKRLTALLYLTERLKKNEQQPTLSKRYLVNTIIRQISSLPDSATLLWPLFVLGNSGLENEDHRRFVLDRLGRMQRTRNLGSVRRARMAVKQAFQKVDLDYRGTRRWGVATIGSISLA